MMVDNTIDWIKQTVKVEIVGDIATITSTVPYFQHVDLGCKNTNSDKNNRVMEPLTHLKNMRDLDADRQHHLSNVED